MRIPRKAVPAQPLTYLWERHKELARQVVAGEKPIDIARNLGMSTCRVSIIMNSPAFKKYVDTLRGRVEIGLMDVRKKINEGAQKGVGILYDIMMDKETPNSAKAKIALEFLDRDGHGKVQKIQSETTHVVLNGDRLAELKERRSRMLEQSKLSVGAIDVEARRIG